MCELPKGRARAILTLVLTALLLVAFSGVGYGASDTDHSTVIFTITAPSYDVTFVVVDEDAQPVVGAVVTLEDVELSKQATTDFYSVAVFEGVPPGTYTYTVEKTGYVTVQDEVEVVDDDFTVDVTLELETYTFTMLEPEGEGEVTPEPGEYVHPYGTKVDLTADPAPGWIFYEWLIDGVVRRAERSITLTIEDDKTAKARFTKPPPPPPPRPPPVLEYTLTIEQEGEGTLDPEPGEYGFDEGTELTITAIADAPGYIFGYWMVDEKSVDVSPPLTAIDIVVTRDLTVTGVFVEPPVVLPYMGKVIDPDVGGVLKAPGMIDLLIPPYAAPDTFEIGVADVAGPEVCAPHGPVDGLVFEVRAYLLPDDEEPVDITEFDEPVTVTLHWQEELEVEDAERILIHYYHELLEMWIPLPTQADVAAQTVTAQIDRPAELVMCIKDKFADIGSRWGEKYILFLSEVGVIDGYPDMKFRPDELVNREQFAKMLVEAAGILVPPVGFIWFEDADEVSDWAVPYVMMAVRHRLVMGFDVNTFRPQENVTRAQVATMISRALGLTPVDEPPFADADEIPDWAVGHVAALSHLDIIQGYLVDGEYYFRPDVVTTRAEAAAFLTRYMEERLKR